jgi:hypothetical protein
MSIAKTQSEEVLYGFAGEQLPESHRPVQNPHGQEWLCDH